MIIILFLYETNLMNACLTESASHFYMSDLEDSKNCTIFSEQKLWLSNLSAKST